MKARIKNIAAGLGFMAVFLGCNLIVTFMVTFVYGMIAGMKSVTEGVVLDAATVTQECLDFIYQHNTVITMAYQLLAVLFVFLIIKLRKKRFLQEITFTKIDKSVVIPLAIMGVAVQFFISYLMELLPIPEAVMNEYIQQSSSILTGGNIVIRIISIAIVAPIVEEIFFRGIVLSRFGKAMPLWLAALLSSLVFGLLHGQLIWITYAAVMGFLFSAVALHEKSILASILLHIAINFSGLFIDMIPCQGIAMVIVCIVAFIVLVGMLYLVMRKEGREIKAVNV